jgi:AcrR family transcriptional regulator
MRKQPRQGRSRATTDAILDAAAHILGERGWAGLTTNAAAEVAGVSIGSLYQYFPNKLALIEAVRRRHFEDVLGVLRAASDSKLTRTRRIETLVDGMMAIHSRFPAAHRVLLEESPRSEDARPAHDHFQMKCREAYETFVGVNSRGEGDVRLAAQVLSGALSGAVHDAARNGTLASPALRTQILHLVGSYLSRH